MKNLFKKVMLFAAAAMAFSSCENDGLTTETILPGVDVTVNATLDEATKSHFGDYNSTDNTYPTLWSGTEKWAIIVNDTKVSSSKIEFTNGNTAASTTVTFEADKAPAAINGVYTLFAVSPESQYVSVSMENDYIRYRIPGSQTPITGSCDEKAQILIAHSEPAEALSGFDISFKHATAYGKVSFVNIAEGGNVTGVTIKSANVALAGRYVYAPSTKTISFKDEGVYEINLSTTSTTDLWFACGPAQVQGKKLTFIINTDKGKLEKEVTMPGNFEIGKVATFKVDMAGIEYPVADVVQYKKVTSLADITAGEYVIVHEVNGTCVLPNAQATSNSSVKQVTLSTKATLANDILTNVDDGVKWILTGSNTAMKVQSYVTKTNYLYTTSNNNGLRVASSGSSTTWSFAALNGGFSMKDSENSRYCGVYTAGTDWRTYTSATQTNYGTKGASLTLYKKVEGGSTGGETPEVPATPVLTVNPTTLSFEAAAASKTVTCTIENEVNGVNVTATESVDWLSTSVSGKTVTVTATENTGAERTATVTISYTGAESKTVTVSQAAKSAEGAPTTVVDVLNRALTGITGTSYSDWSGKTSTSTAVYAGNSAGGNDAIQLRSSNNNSGIVTTKSGGKARKIVVTWNSETSSGRILQIYGKNTAYSAASDLYSTSTQGTKLGEIKYGTSTELTISGDYAYIGLRSSSNAMYLTEIQITWEEASGDTPATPVLSINPTTLSFDAAAGSKTITCTIENEVSGQNVTATSSDTSWLTTSVSGKTVTVTATANTGAARTANVTIAYTGAESKTVTVSQAAGNTGGGTTVKGYKKVTTITSGKKYLIVGGGLSKVLKPTTGSGKKNSADVTITDGFIASTSTIDGYAVTITANGSNYNIAFVSGSTTNYLYYGSSTNLNTGTTAKSWKVSAASKAGTFAFVDASTTSRGLIFRASSYNQFGGYATSNINGTEYYNIDLYEYQD